MQQIVNFPRKNDVKILTTLQNLRKKFRELYLHLHRKFFYEENTKNKYKIQLRKKCVYFHF